jgi:4-amino-4-deoxy-L-arabinose transferase-like glycosyltransferase
VEITPKVERPGSGSAATEEQRGGGASSGFRRPRTRGVYFFSTSVPQFSVFLLFSCILLVYVPFLGNRVVRPAGDDKVYVSQTVEMARAGHWFLQTLANEPNYFKGPAHYILVRIGIILFGFNMWATVWMNLLLTLLGAVCLARVVQKNMKEFPGWGFFAGMAFALNAGIYSHMFASQMEVEAASMMAIGVYLLDRAGPGRGDLMFWLCAGFLGWLKSPLHAVFLGVTALLFWTWNRELLPRLRSPAAWGAVVAGILVCSIGYAPAYFWDRENFVMAYVFRETLWKPANGAPWHYPIIPLFSYYLMPWMLPAWVAFADGLTRPFRRRQRPIRSTAGSRRVVALGLCLMIPSILFFLWHPYRGQNYDLPVIGGLLLVVTSLWASRAHTWDNFYQLSLGLTAAVLLVAVSLITIVTRHFDPMPFWWNSWKLPILWLGFFLSARGLWREGMTLHMARPDSLSRRAVWAFLALGSLLTLLGQREMIDIQDRIYAAKKNGEELHLSYYNLPKHPDTCCSNIWSEWGYLNFMIPYPTSGVFKDAELVDAARRGDLILVPGDDFLADMKTKLGAQFPVNEWKIEPWRRWKTKGKNAAGVPAWREAWDTRDLTKLEKNFWMVKVK